MRHSVRMARTNKISPSAVTVGRIGANQRIRASPPKMNIKTLLQVRQAIPKNDAMLPNPAYLAEQLGCLIAANTPARLANMKSGGSSHPSIGVFLVKNGLRQTAVIVPIAAKLSVAIRIPRMILRGS